MGTIFAGAGIASIVGLFVAAITQAATVSAVSDLYLGHDTTVRGSFTRVGSKFFPIFLVFLLVVLIFFTMFIMAVIAIGIAAALLHSPALVVIGLILALIPALYFVCRIAVVVPSAMLENTGVVRSLGRSMELTKGYAGQIFLIFLLVAIIALIASVTLSVLFLGNPLTAFTAHRPLHMGTIVLYQLFNYATRVLIGPIATIACCLMYYNLRVRKEAFDVQHLMASLGTQPAPGTPPAI